MEPYWFMALLYNRNLFYYNDKRKKAKTFYGLCDGGDCNTDGKLEYVLSIEQME